MLAYMSLLKNEKIEPWLHGNVWACYVYGNIVLRNGKPRRFKTRQGAIKGGKDYLTYAHSLSSLVEQTP